MKLLYFVVFYLTADIHRQFCLCQMTDEEISFRMPSFPSLQLPIGSYYLANVC